MPVISHKERRRGHQKYYGHCEKLEQSFHQHYYFISQLGVSCYDGYHLTAHDKGQVAMEQFAVERLSNKRSVNYFTPLPQLKLKMFRNVIAKKTVWAPSQRLCLVCPAVLNRIAQ